ncbi:RNA polymerase sigma factor SigA [Porphyridium purpureum]|uniref:RNA polymerase sigma factor SigA n=1 Tax=Porphyridium purpureum TaxID=35688 RepID=A0A5J4YRP4_PORPP|nr:RNA polymerase sigma factor SigA [Porphyridium purpureum]|eukprot:POR2549..scf229_5
MEEEEEEEDGDGADGICGVFCGGQRLRHARVMVRAAAAGVGARALVRVRPRAGVKRGCVRCGVDVAAARAAAPARVGSRTRSRAVRSGNAVKEPEGAAAAAAARKRKQSRRDRTDAQHATVSLVAHVVNSAARERQSNNLDTRVDEHTLSNVDDAMSDMDVAVDYLGDDGFETESSRASSAMKSSIDAYLAAVGNEPLLSREAEIRLAERVQELQKWEAAWQLLSESEPEAPRMRCTKRWAELLRIPVGQFEAELRDAKKARETMIHSNLKLVVSIAMKESRRSGTGTPVMDLIQEGNVALIRALHRFDPSRHVRFSTYATWYIRDAVWRCAHRQQHSVTLPSHVTWAHRKIQQVAGAFRQQYDREPALDELARACGMSVKKVRLLLNACAPAIALDEFGLDELSAHESSSPMQVVEHLHLIEEQIQAEQLLATELLDELELRAIKSRLGTAAASGRLPSYSELGKLLNVSRYKAEALEQRALGKLRRALRVGAPDQFA